MEELIGVLQEIRDGINNINCNIEQLKDAVDELKGSGLYNSVSDVCDKMESLQIEVNSIKGSTGYDLTDIYSEISSIKGSTGYDLTDIHSDLSNIDNNLNSININTI